MRSRRALTAAVIFVLAAGIVLRFVSTGPLWEDEAQSVAIASEPLRLLPHALRHDGSPPLWYYLLHFWMRAFGDGTRSVRVLSGIPAVLSLPVMERLGRRIGGATAGIVAMVLLASSPYAISYAVEARMYSLVILWSLLAAHALIWVHRSPGWRPVGALAVMTALMLYTHYDAIWLGLLVGAGELFLAVRRKDAGARRVIIGLLVGAALFAPWLPILRYQSANTGAKWEPPPNAGAIFETLQQWAGGFNPWGSLGLFLMIGLAVVAVCGHRDEDGKLTLGAPVAPAGTRAIALSGGAVIFMVIESAIARQAFADRYTADVVGLFLLAIALGAATLPSVARRAVIGLLVACGLAAGGIYVFQPRTEVAAAADVIEARALPGAVVLDCPDQLGPSTHRLLPADLAPLSYPTLGPTRVIDWVGWSARQTSVTPIAVAERVSRLALHHQLFVIWGSPTAELEDRCTSLIIALAAIDGQPQKLLRPKGNRIEPTTVDEWIVGDHPIPTAVSGG